MPFFVGELNIGNDCCCECGKPLTDSRYNASFEGYQHDPDKEKNIYSDYRNLSFCNIDCCRLYLNKVMNDLQNNQTIESGIDYNNIFENREKYQTIEFHDLQSCDPDIGYAIPFLDGIFCGVCTKANSKEGWVEVLVFNGNDPLICNGGLVHHKVYGDVVLIKVSPDGNPILNRMNDELLWLLETVSSAIETFDECNGETWVEEIELKDGDIIIRLNNNNKYMVSVSKVM